MSSNIKMESKNHYKKNIPHLEKLSSNLETQLIEMENENKILKAVISDQENFIKNIANKLSNSLFKDLDKKYDDKEIINFATEILESIPDKDIHELLKLNHVKNDDKENKSDSIFNLDLTEDDFNLAGSTTDRPVSSWHDVVVSKKLAGQSSIRTLNHAVLTQICHSLDIEKKSGTDWRCLALRTGVDECSIRENTGPLCSFTLTLLKQLANDPLFSVRHLHRHFISPQMKQFELARVLETNFEL